MKTKRQILKELNGEDKALRWIHMVAIGMVSITVIAVIINNGNNIDKITNHPFIQLLFTFVMLSISSYIYLRWKFKK